MLPTPFAEISILTAVNSTAQTTESKTKPVNVQQSTDAGILERTPKDRMIAHGTRKAALKRTPIPTPKISLESMIVVFGTPLIILLRMVLSVYSLPVFREIKAAEITNNGTTNIPSKEPLIEITP